MNRRSAMNRSAVLSGLAAIGLGVIGCSTANSANTWAAHHARVSVRFATPGAISAFAMATPENAEAMLVADSVAGEDSAIWCEHGLNSDAFPSQHAVLWGGPFSGNDVTYASVPLTPGSYTFALFDHEEGAAYQGWIDVHRGGDGLIELLTEWRDTVSEQREWSGFERKIRGDFTSIDDAPFRDFMKELRRIERLERKIDFAVRKEIKKASRNHTGENSPAISADVLLMPGHANFFRSSTQPTFSQAELAAARAGEPVTKVVFVADPTKAAEKLRRVDQVWSSLQRRQNVVTVELNRLKKRHRFYTMTDHLYDHGVKFTKNAQRLQHVEGMADQLDRRMASLNEQRHALLLVHALFSTDPEFDAFGKEEARLLRRRIVGQEEKHQIDLKFDASPENSCRRVSLERQRQRVAARLVDLDERIQRIDNVQVALGQMRNSSSVIHRQGTARVLATLVSAEMPTHLAQAIQRESLMTVRLQSAPTMFVPQQKDAVPVSYRP